jgi:hypothetical protein
LISATIIPLSLMAALLVLNLQGVTINVMTLAGLAIAIGAVVDDAIVDVENVVRRLRRLRSEGSTQSTASIVLEASLEVRGSIIYASLIEISALLPVFFLQGPREHSSSPYTACGGKLVSLHCSDSHTSDGSCLCERPSRTPIADHPAGIYDRVLGSTWHRPCTAPYNRRRRFE